MLRGSARGAWCAAACARKLRLAGRDLARRACQDGDAGLGQQAAHLLGLAGRIAADATCSCGRRPETDVGAGPRDQAGRQEE